MHKITCEKFWMHKITCDKFWMHKITCEKFWMPRSPVKSEGILWLQKDIGTGVFCTPTMLQSLKNSKLKPCLVISKM